jgi:hypothetical protein
MATFTVPAGTLYTIYNPFGNWLATAVVQPPGWTITDNDPGDQFFSSSDTLTLDYGNGTVENFSFLGRMTADPPGMPLVINQSTPSNATFVLNRHLSQSEFPTLVDLQIDQNATFDTICFAQGTRIATPDGWAEVQDLAMGDTILTAEGRVVPVLWVGRQTLVPMFMPADRGRLVRIAAGALGEGLPLRDLVVTADHALCLSGVLVTAGALIGAQGIALVPRDEMGQSVTVYHVETQDHDLILAEGVPSETFIDYASRRVFDNYAEFEAAYPQGRPLKEMTLPRISAARHLPRALRARLGMRQSA